MGACSSRPARQTDRQPSVLQTPRPLLSLCPLRRSVHQICLSIIKPPTHMTYHRQHLPPSCPSLQPLSSTSKPTHPNPPPPLVPSLSIPPPSAGRLPLRRPTPDPCPIPPPPQQTTNVKKQKQPMHERTNWTEGANLYRVSTRFFTLLTPRPAVRGGGRGQSLPGCISPCQHFSLSAPANTAKRARSHRGLPARARHSCECNASKPLLTAAPPRSPPLTRRSPRRRARQTCARASRRAPARRRARSRTRQRPFCC